MDALFTQGVIAAWIFAKKLFPKKNASAFPQSDATYIKKEKTMKNAKIRFSDEIALTCTIAQVLLPMTAVVGMLYGVGLVIFSLLVQ